MFRVRNYIMGKSIILSIASVGSWWKCLVCYNYYSQNQLMFWKNIFRKVLAIFLPFELSYQFYQFIKFHTQHNHVVIMLCVEYYLCLCASHVTWGRKSKHMRFPIMASSKDGFPNVEKIFACLYQIREAYLGLEYSKFKAWGSQNHPGDTKSHWNPLKKKEEEEK